MCAWTHSKQNWRQGHKKWPVCLCEWICMSSWKKCDCPFCSLETERICNTDLLFKNKPSYDLLAKAIKCLYDVNNGVNVNQDA